jgi:hypothetical protein
MMLVYGFEIYLKLKLKLRENEREKERKITPLRGTTTYMPAAQGQRTHSAWNK